MMKRGCLFVFITILITTGCSGIRTNQDYDPSTDFTSVKTFSWASMTQPETGDQRIDNPFRNQRIRAAIDRVLKEKGFIYRENEAADIKLRYKYTLRQRIDSDSARSGIGFGIGSFGRSGGIAIGTGTGNSVGEYDEGSLIIDFLDSSQETLLWRGSGTQRFEEYDDPEESSKDINALVEKILNQFPPKK